VLFRIGFEFLMTLVDLLRFEPVGILRCHRNKKHNNHLVSVSAMFYSFHIHRNNNNCQLALFPVFGSCILDK
jgi:hypothetical protein